MKKVKVSPKNIKSFLKKVFTSKDFYFSLALTVLNIFAVFWAAYYGRGISGKKFIILISLVVEIALLFGYHWAKRKHLSLEKIFLLLVIPLGLLFIAIMPCGQSPDETTHFYRIYGITEGYLIAPQSETNSGGTELPVEIEDVFHISPERGLYQSIAESLSAATSGEREDKNYVTAALYNPICYLPQALGVLIGKLFGSSILTQAYLARIFNFLGFVCLAYFAIKYMPKYRKFLLFIALFPITLQEVTSLAPDALTIGLAFLLVAFVCHLTFAQKTPLTTRQYILLYALASVIGFCKIVYLPLLLLYLIIPKERFGGKKAKLIHASIIVFMVLALNLAWFIISSRYLVNVQPGVSPSDQIRYLLTHPIHYLATILATLNSQADFFAQGTFGMSLGHFAIALPKIYFYPFFTFFILLLAQNTERLPLKRFDRIVFAATALIILALVFTSLYIQWTPVANATVVGVQGRYFLPVLLLTPLILNSVKKPQAIHEGYISERQVVIFGIFSNVCALICILIANI